jgi:hypothetical protein
MLNGERIPLLNGSVVSSAIKLSGCGETGGVPMHAAGVIVEKSIFSTEMPNIAGSAHIISIQQYWNPMLNRNQTDP